MNPKKSKQNPLNRRQYNQWESVREESRKLVPQTEAEYKDPKFQEYAQLEGEVYSPFGLYQGQPILSVPNISEIWPYPEDRDEGDSTDYIGQDYKRSISNLPGGLYPEQIQFLTSELLRNVTFGDLLGTGAFGKVYEVWADSLNVETNKWQQKQLACKVIRHRSTKEEDIQKSMIDVYILQCLKHENVCKYMDVIGIPDSVTNFPNAVVCLFLEYCDSDLHKIRLEGKKLSGLAPFEAFVFSEKMSKHWFLHIAKGLEYIHDNGVAHRDIKQNNILLRFGQSVADTYEDRFLRSTFKLADFGISRVQTTWSKTHQDAQNSDIASLVYILFETAIPGPKNYTNERKFLDRCIYNDWAEDDPPEWSTVSPQLKDLVGKMAYKDIRIPASQIVKHAWLKKEESTKRSRSLRQFPIIAQNRPQYGGVSSRRKSI